MFSLQCSWINRLLEGAFHEWKVMILHLIKTFLGKKFKSHSDLDVNAFLLKNFTRFYQEIFTCWSKNISSSATLPWTIISQQLWKIDGKSKYITNFLNKIFRGKWFQVSEDIKSWSKMKRDCDLPEHLKFHWNQLINTIPKDWK